MKWENLQTKNCPYCDGSLVDGDDTEMVQCTKCRFEISKERFMHILEHRRTDGGGVKIKWQMLHDAKCPVCENFLKPTEGRYRIFACSSAACTFRIREDRMQGILADKEHPANRFNKNNQT